MQQEPEHLICLCQVCSCHIEFPSQGVGEEVTCPHCGMSTVLYRVQQVEPQDSNSGQLVPPSPVAHAQLGWSNLPSVAKLILSFFGTLVVFWAGWSLYDSFKVQSGLKSSKAVDHAIAEHEQRANQFHVSAEVAAETAKFIGNVQRLLPSLTSDEQKFYLDLVATFVCPQESKHSPNTNLQMLRLLNENTQTVPTARSLMSEIKSVQANRAHK